MVQYSTPRATLRLHSVVHQAAGVNLCVGLEVPVTIRPLFASRVSIIVIFTHFHASDGAAPAAWTSLW